MAHLEDEFCFQATHGLLLLRNDSITKKYFTVNTANLNFVKKTRSMLYPVKRHLNY